MDAIAAIPPPPPPLSEPVLSKSHGHAFGDGGDWQTKPQLPTPASLGELRFVANPGAC